MDPLNEKLYYKIGEVAKIIQIEPYVIRYWEKEFRFLKPYKSKSSHRLYSKEQIERLLLIKDFLYNKKYTIEGARKALRSREGNPTPEIPAPDSRQKIDAALNELDSVKSILTSRKRE